MGLIYKRRMQDTANPGKFPKGKFPVNEESIYIYAASTNPHECQLTESLL